MKKALVRVGFFSIKTDAALSSVRWQEGVGLVGTVWADHNIAGTAMDARIVPFPEKAGWSAVAAPKRLNMPWELAKRMQKIEAVFAVAVLADHDQGDVVAVLSADTTIDDLPKFDAAGIKAFLRQAAWGAWRSRSLKS